MFDPRKVVRIIIRNLKEVGNPLGIKLDTKILGYKESGEFTLYTGMLYQMVPYINRINSIMKILENGFERIAFFVHPLSKFLKLTSKDDYYIGILRKIWEILEKEVDFSYYPDIDLYSGVILYEMGCDRDFVEYANIVTEKLEENGIKKLITIDPHTTYALKILYPEFVGAKFKVKNYLELLNSSLGMMRKKERKIVFHHPCYYSRYLGMDEVIDEVLEKNNIDCINVRDSRNLTSCCGGIVESISPRLCYEISKNRYSQLKGFGCEVVTACPICLGNLKRFGEVKDLAEILYGVCRHEREN